MFTYSTDICRERSFTSNARRHVNQVVRYAQNHVDPQLSQSLLKILVPQISWASPSFYCHYPFPQPRLSY